MEEEKSIDIPVVTMQFANGLKSNEPKILQQSIFDRDDENDELSRSDISLGNDDVFYEREPLDNFQSAIDFSYGASADSVGRMENSAGSDTFHSVGQYSYACSDSQKSIGGAGSFCRGASSMTIPVSVCEEASEGIDDSDNSGNFEQRRNSFVFEMPLKGALDWNEAAALQKDSENNTTSTDDPLCLTNFQTGSQENQYPSVNIPGRQSKLVCGNLFLTNDDKEVNTTNNQESSVDSCEDEDTFEVGRRSISLSEGILSRSKADVFNALTMDTNNYPANVSRHKIGNYESSATINFEDSRSHLHDSSGEFKAEYGVDSFKIRELESRMKLASQITSAVGSSNDAMHFFYNECNDDEGYSPHYIASSEAELPQFANESGDNLSSWTTSHNKPSENPLKAEKNLTRSHPTESPQSANILTTSAIDHSVCLKDTHHQQSKDLLNSFEEGQSGTTMLSNTDYYIPNDSQVVETTTKVTSSVAVLLEDSYNTKTNTFESVCETLETDSTSRDSKSTSSQARIVAKYLNECGTPSEQPDNDSVLSDLEHSQSILQPFSLSEFNPPVSQNANHDNNPQIEPNEVTYQGNSDVTVPKPSSSLRTSRVGECTPSLINFGMHDANQSLEENENKANSTSEEDWKMSLRIADFMRQIDNPIHGSTASDVNCETQQLCYDHTDICNMECTANNLDPILIPDRGPQAISSTNEEINFADCEKVHTSQDGGDADSHVEGKGTAIDSTVDRNEALPPSLAVTNIINKAQCITLSDLDDSSSSTSIEGNMSAFETSSPVHEKMTYNIEYEGNRATNDDLMSSRIADLMRKIDSSIHESTNFNENPLREGQFDASHDDYSESSRDRSNSTFETGPIVKLSSHHNTPEKCPVVAADSSNVIHLCKSDSPEITNASNSQVFLTGFESAVDLLGKNSIATNVLHDPSIKSSSNRRVPKNFPVAAGSGTQNNRDSFTLSQLCDSTSSLTSKEGSKNIKNQDSLAEFKSAVDFLSQDSIAKYDLHGILSPLGLPKLPVNNKVCKRLSSLDESSDGSSSSTSIENATDDDESSSSNSQIPSSSYAPFVPQSLISMDQTDSNSESMAASEFDDIRPISNRRRSMASNTSSGMESGAFESAVDFLGHESIAKYDLYEVLSPLKSTKTSTKKVQIKDLIPSKNEISLGRNKLRNLELRSPLRAAPQKNMKAKLCIPFSKIDESSNGDSNSSEESPGDEGDCQVRPSASTPLSRNWLVSIDETDNSESMAASELDDLRPISNRRRSMASNTSSAMGSGAFESAVDFLGHESIAAYDLYEVLSPLKSPKKKFKASQHLRNKMDRLDNSTRTIEFQSPMKGTKKTLSNMVENPSSVAYPIWNSSNEEDSSVTCSESSLKRNNYRSFHRQDSSLDMNGSKLIIHETFHVPPPRELQEIEEIQPPRFSVFVPISNFLSTVGSGLVSMRSSLVRDSSNGMDGNQKQPKDYRMKDLQRLKILGEGQFGQVWLVSDKQKNAYALKMFAKYDLIQEGEAKMILEEARMHQLVHNHPFIVKLITVFQDDSLLYLLQQFAQGGELFSVIERYSEAHETELEGSVVGMPEYQAKFYTVCIADALRHMHSMDIVYRDLKPENCMIDKDGYPLLIDMGYAKHVPDKTFTFCGTPRFLPPEAINPDTAGYDWTADHWSLGILVYEMLSGGVNPFSYDGISELELFTAIEDGTYPSIDISSAATDLIANLLTADPMKRLGAKDSGGTQAILDHAWLFDMNLSDLKQRLVEAPWKPQTKNALDTSCFDDWSDIEDRGSQKYPKLTKKEEAVFNSIPY
jgi:serine/threonine protein kinase